MPPVIRMASQNCKCPVELLRHYQPGQCMRQSHRPKRQQQLRSLARCLCPPACPTNSKNNMLAPLVSPRTKPSGKSLRTHLPPTAIQQHYQRRRPSLLAFQPVKQRLLGLETLRTALGKSRAAFKIALNQRVQFVLRSRPGSNVCQRNLHAEENSSTRLSCVARLAGQRVEKTQTYCLFLEFNNPFLQFSITQPLIARQTHSVTPLP